MRVRIKTLQEMIDSFVEMNSANTRPRHWNTAGDMDHLFGQEVEVTKEGVLLPIRKHRYINREHIAEYLDSWTDRIESSSGSTEDCYKVPDNAKELQDLIEHKSMNFSIGSIFEACYRLGECTHSDKIKDLQKIIFFANRELDLLKDK